MTNGTTTYRIIFTDGTNQGSFAIDAIADTVNGTWRDSSDEIGFVTVSVENATALETLLNEDDRVVEYQEMF
ncbi:MAG: hypothetical protein E6Q97_39325 [Desulfurellales bacterium]|nr:MAG: hypothetical protein E6Q97_39325 [Desulfurellales bacterium]